MRQISIHLFCVCSLKSRYRLSAACLVKMVLLYKILPLTIIVMVSLPNSADLKGQGQNVTHL